MTERWPGATALIVAGCLSSAEPATAVDALACSDLPPSKFSLFMIEDTRVRQNLDQEPSQLRQLLDASETRAFGRAHPFLVLEAKPVGMVRLEARVVQREAGFCAAPKAVRIGIGLTRRAIHMLRRAAADACVRDELLRHAERHLRSDHAIVEDVLQRTEEPFAATLSAMKRLPAASADRAAAEFQASLRTTVDLTLAAIAARRTEAHAEIDATDQLRALRTACGGRIAELDDTVMAKPDEL